MMDIELIKQREEIFDAYRESIKNIETLKEEILAIRISEEKIHESMNKAQKEYSKLAGLIDIMLREDCDPMTAKLKFSDIEEKKEAEDVIYQISSSGNSVNKYGYRRHDNRSDMYIEDCSPRVMKEASAVPVEGLWSRVCNAILRNGGR